MLFKERCHSNTTSDRGNGFESTRGTHGKSTTPQL
jgi:hypothetical protein